MALYQQTYRKTLAYALRRTISQSDAQDVVAETYLVAWRRASEFLPADQPQAWLYSVAYRVLANQWRTRSRQKALSEKVLAYEQYREIDPSLTAEAYDELLTVELAMSTLSDRDQEILRLAAYEELDHKEIAKAMGVNQTLVKSVLFRARQRLSRTLENQMRHPTAPGHKQSPGIDGSNGESPQGSL